MKIRIQIDQKYAIKINKMIISILKQESKLKWIQNIKEWLGKFI